MAKARRAASRQGQLKRKKNTKGPSGIPSTLRGATVPETEDSIAVPAGVEEDDIDAEALAAGEAAVAPQASRPAPAARTPRGEFSNQGRLRGERPAAYLYVGAEFQRILVLTSAIVAALVILGIVL